MEHFQVAALLVGEKGDRNICAYRGALEALGPEDIDLSVFDSARIVNIGSIFALKNLDGDGVMKILERAKAAAAVAVEVAVEIVRGLKVEG